MVREMEPRNAGMTDGENLACQVGRPHMQSPNVKLRKERSGFDWDLYRQPVQGDIKWY